MHTKDLLKPAFYISLAAMLCVMLYSGANVGFCSDEMDMNQYGKANISFYKSGGKDTSFLNLMQENDSLRVMKTLPFYGSNFEYIAHAANILTGTLDGKQEYNVRHAVNQVMAIIAILFCGLIATRLKGYRAALLSAWFLFLTPTFFGWALFDTKDLPFCTGYIASIYFLILFLEQLPRPTVKATICLMLALFFTLGIRIGGLLLYGYLLLFIPLMLRSKNEKGGGLIKKKDLLPLPGKLVLVIGGSLVLTILSWPYVLIDPMHNFVAAIESAKKFPADIAMNFKGDVIHSTVLPGDYLPTYFFITIPVMLLALVPASFVLIALRSKQIKWQPVLLVVVAAIVPLVYSQLSSMTLYNGWRHLMFFYPCCMVVAGIGADMIVDTLKKPVLQMGFGVLLLGGFIHPIKGCVANGPYQYVYYNELEGFKDAYYNYENDVWSISMKPAIDWLMINEHIADRKDSVLIATNVGTFTNYYLRTHYPGVKVRAVAISTKNYSNYKWDYLLLNTIFLQTNYLQDHFPPEGTIHTIDADDRPLTAIVKDTTHLQYYISDAVENQDDYLKADSLARVYMATTHNANPNLLGLLAMINARLYHYDRAIDYGMKAIQSNPNDFSGRAAMALVCFKQKKIEAAVEHINICLAQDPYNEFILQLADSIKLAMPQ